MNYWRSLHSLFGELYRRFVARITIRGQRPIRLVMEGACTRTGDLVRSSHRSHSIPRKKTLNPFESEAQLVHDFVLAIRSTSAPIQAAHVGAEFNYLDGRTDVITIHPDGDIYAFEAKLTHWRVALHQAYRATSFANRAYVVMPFAVAHRALAHRNEFNRRGVGLCAMRPDGTVIVLHEALRVVPYMPSVSTRAVEFLRAQT